MNKALLFPMLLVLGGCTAQDAPETAGKGAPPGFPAFLKNDAFDYYGLGNDKPVRLVVEENGMPMPGTRTIKLQKVEGDKAIYTLTQEGSLGNGQGDITLSLERDGLYTMASTAGKIKPHSLEMPAKLEVGGGWKDHTEMQDGKIVLDNDLKIVGKERVQTPGGTFDDALHVTSTGGGTMNGPVKLETESWYVRGLGAVKQILRITPEKGPKRTVTMELAAPEKAESGAPAGGGRDTPPPTAAPPTGGQG